ncbi:MAG: hypothetical protein KF901_10885 [Myxococcales bacterium]|nr:hypothetical protein [Myxococcales bacterium]
MTVSTAAAFARSVVAAGHPLRLWVDGRRRDVLVPAGVRADHGLNLFLDVAPTNSAAVDVQDEGLAADLSFSGHAFRVWVPWIAVQLLVDLATGAETAFPEHAPPPELPADLATDPWSMCSFCGMDPRDRAVVVGGVEARICDVCVAAAAEVVAAQRASSAPDRET